MFHPINPAEMFKQPARTVKVKEPFNDGFTATFVGFGLLDNSTSLIVIDKDGRVHNVNPSNARP